jgi:methyl-accepting chemotaxis protein
MQRGRLRGLRGVSGGIIHSSRKEGSRMAKKAVRKPVGNFFIKKSLQLRLIVNVMTVSIVSSIVSSGTLLLVYFYKYDTTVLYMFNEFNNVLQKESIIRLILPTLVISSVVGLALAFGIGLYASRKYAVPVFKIEQWVSQILNGQVTAVLRFREKEEMKDLSDKCNELGTMFREVMLGIQKDVKALRNAGVRGPEIDAISEKLGRLELEGSQDL